MSGYVPPRHMLRGLSVQRAELFGKPGWMARYEGASATSHRACEGAVCVCCGRPASNVHHVSPLGRGRSFTLDSQVGSWDLKPALFAVCGTGTTGCHNGFHGGARYKAEWVWDTDRDAEEWWSGRLLLTVGPHSPLLYLYGGWRITDAATGRETQVRWDA